MKVLNKVLIGVASVAMLTACASKTDYATFHKKAQEAAEKAKEVSFSAVTVSGSYVDDDGKKQNWDKITVQFDKGTFKAGNISHLDEVAVALMLTGSVAQLIAEADNTTYYAGSTFKVVYEKDSDKSTALYNQYGLLTSAKSSDGSDLKVSYKK